MQYKPFIDERRFHYGFFVGLHDQTLNLENNGYIDPATGAQWLVENDQHGPGFSVGVLGEWRMHKYLGLRLMPSLHFGSKHLKFRNLADGTTAGQNMKSTYIALPLNLKVSAPRYNNFRPYVIAGLNPMIDLTARKRHALRTKPMDCYLEVGMGCDIYLPFFKLIPELKFCFGLADILQKDRSDLIDTSLLKYTEAVDKARSKMIVLTLYFE